MTVTYNNSYPLILPWTQRRAGAGICPAWPEFASVAGRTRSQTHRPLGENESKGKKLSTRVISGSSYLRLLPTTEYLLNWEQGGYINTLDAVNEMEV